MYNRPYRNSEYVNQFGRRVRRGNNNLEYYINGVRVTKSQMANHLSRLYNAPPSKIMETRVREAKMLMRTNNCSSWSFSDGTLIKY